MKIQIDYGRTGIDVTVPDRNLKAVLGLRPAEPLPNPAAEVRRRLESPTGGAPFSEICRGRKNACILICDITRPVPNELLLTPLLEEITKAGIPDERVLILVATGLHREATNAEIIEMVGATIARQYRVESHNARDMSAHVYLGATTDGTPAWVDRRYVEADLKITTGLIEPHLMAGFSGGRKVICPGIVGVETLKCFHGVSILQSPLATAGRVPGNPIHALSLETARLAGCDFIMNVALNDSRQVTGVFCGEMLEAWLEGVRHVQSVAEAPLDEPVEIVITSAAGYPLDGTFYQSVKGLVGALPAVKQGGTLIMAAQMDEGIGSPEFTELLHSYTTIHQLMSDLETPGFFCIDQWQAQELARVCRTADVSVYSDSVPGDLLRRSHVTPADSVESALDQALQRHGPGARVAVIPRGPYVLPVISG